MGKLLAAALVLILVSSAMTLVLLHSMPGHHDTVVHAPITSRAAARSKLRKQVAVAAKSSIAARAFAAGPAAAAATAAAAAATTTPVATVVPVATWTPPLGTAAATFYSQSGCAGEGKRFEPSTIGSTSLNGAFSWCHSTEHRLADGRGFDNNVKSVRVTGDAVLQLFGQCSGAESSYWSDVMPVDGCTDIFSWPPTHAAALRDRSSPALSQVQSPMAWPTTLDAPAAARAWADGVRASGKTPYRIVFSAESSTYQSIQTRANLLAFERSGQHADGGRWTRLLTAGATDDLAAAFPTFAAPRHPYSRRYGPLNKPDVIIKWYASASAPVKGVDDVVVVIDPDNWLVRSVQEWVHQVRPGQALGQAAWFVSATRQVKELWRMFCHKRCVEAENELDLVGVPYFVARDDLEKIAPLWRDYTIEMKDRVDNDEAFKSKYAGVQIAWSTEMYAYVFAAAELGIRHTVISSLQRRDVDGGISSAAAAKQKIPMIHMGRAWFPKNAKTQAAPFQHTEGRNFNYRGWQVWCKVRAYIFSLALSLHFRLSNSLLLRQFYSTLTVQQHDGRCAAVATPTGYGLDERGDADDAARRARAVRSAPKEQV